MNQFKRHSYKKKRKKKFKYLKNIGELANYYKQKLEEKKELKPVQGEPKPMQEEAKPMQKISWFKKILNWFKKVVLKK